MARRSPALVQVTTASTGFGPYTLTNTVPAAVGYRSIANAVADGSIANGDELFYQIVNPTSGGTGKLFERGRGTINTSTLVLTVVAVIERSTSLASGGGWGSGVKDVIIMPPGAESAAMIDAANTWTAAQVFNDSVSVSHLTVPQWRLVISGLLRGRLLGESDSTRVDYINTSGIVKGRVIVGDTTLQFFDGSTTRNIGVLDSGLKVVQLAGGNVNKLPWYQAAAPTGWVKDTSQNDKAMRVVSGTGGGSGGSRALSSAVVGGTALSTNQLNAHSHTVAYSTVSVEGLMPSSPVSVVSALGVGAGSGNTSSVGADLTHDHALALAYIDLIICSLT